MHLSSDMVPHSSTKMPYYNSPRAMYRAVQLTVARYLNHYTGDIGNRHDSHPWMADFLSASDEQIKAMPLDMIECTFDICSYRIRMRDHATKLAQVGGIGLPFGAQCENFDEVESEMLDLQFDPGFDSTG